MTLNVPLLVGISIAALAGIYLALKFGKLMLKLLLLLGVLAALGLAAWWYFAAHHG